jgi:hypothetical protein
MASRLNTGTGAARNYFGGKLLHMTYINDIEMLKVLPLFPMCHRESNCAGDCLGKNTNLVRG